MFIVILLAIVVIAIAFYARSRGRSPWIWGLIALIGHLAMSFLTSVLTKGLAKVEGNAASLFLTVAPWLWTVLVVGYLWFVVGPTDDQQPD